MANSTIFDDVFRTMLEKMPQLIIPLINEVFGTDYPGDIPIVQRRNEHVIYLICYEQMGIWGDHYRFPFVHSR